MAIHLIPSIAALLAITLGFYKIFIHPLFISPLSRIPAAHWSARISPLWILTARFRCRENRSLHAAHVKFGPVVLVGPNELSVNDANGIRTVYGGSFEKGEWYTFFDNYGQPNIFSTPHSRPHSTRKRMVTHIYSKSTLHASEPLHAQSHALVFNRLLPLLATSATTTVNINEIWYATTMDFITAYLFGLSSSTNFLEDVAFRKHWLGLFHGRHTYPYFPQELPNLTRWAKRLGINLVPKFVDAANEELEVWAQVHCEKAMEVLKGEREPVDEPVVFGGILSGIVKEEKEKGVESAVYGDWVLNKELGVASEMIDELAAGFETSGVTLTYISHYISLNLPLQRLLRAELLTLTPGLKFGPGFKNKVPAPKEIEALPLLHAIIMETLRLRSAIPGGQPRMTPFPSSTLGPYTIPGGMRISAQAHSLHRNGTAFPNPEEWDHTRWLDGSNGLTEEQRKKRDRYFWAFGSGGRMCVGSNFAMHEIKLVIAAVYTNFESFVVDDEGVEQEDGYLAGPIGNRLMVRFEKVV